MKNKKVLIMSLVLGGAFILTTAFASAASIWTIDNGLVSKVLTIGTNKNNGKLYVKGKISNPVKDRPTVIDDNLKVSGDINGKLNGTKAYETQGIIKASVEIGSNGYIKKSFNKLSNKTITSTEIGWGTYLLDFGADLTNKYVVISGNSGRIASVSGETATVLNSGGYDTTIIVY